MSADEIEILPAYGNYDAVRSLFDEYTQMPGVVETCYKSYEAERDNLPGDFAKPDGRLYLAYVGGKPAGCIAMRRFDEHRCEMKRLFVRKEFRGLNIGEMLARRILADAQEAGYRSMVLSTMETMKTAHGLYKRLGFTEMQPVVPDSRENILYFEMKL